MSGNGLSVQIPFGMDNVSPTNQGLTQGVNFMSSVSTNPGSFVDMSRKVDQILTLLQGSNQTFGQPAEPIVQSLMNIRTQLSNPSRGSENGFIEPPLPFNDSQFNVTAMNSNSILSTGFQLAASPFFQAGPSQVSPPILQGPNQVGPSQDQVLALLSEIRARIGGSNLEEPLSSNLNRLQQMVISNPSSQVIQTSDPNGLRQSIMPSLNDTLLQTSNSLISTIRNEIQAILGRYTDVNQSLNGLRASISQSDPSSLARKNDIEAQFNQLSGQIQQYTQMMQRLHDTTAQLVGQSNDNSRLLYGIGTKMQSLDRLQEAVNNANSLLTQSTNTHRGNIDQLMQENLLLRQNLENLISALKLSTSRQSSRVSKH